MPTNQVVDFTALYRDNCAGCHGENGTWGPAPPLNDPVFLTIVPNADLRQVVASGRAGTLMPAFADEQGGTLTMAQVEAVADGLKKQWAPAEKPKMQPPPYQVSGKGNPERGAETFDRACSGCHGGEGEGMGPETRINDPIFLALTSDQALRRYIITGRPDFGMPDFAGKRPDDPDFKPLSSEEVTDLVAYLASWRQRPQEQKQRK